MILQYVKKQAEDQACFSIIIPIKQYFVVIIKTEIMKKRSILFLLLCSIIASITVWSFQIVENTEKEEVTEKISGAYEALNFMGNRQTFPSGKIPANAYSSAWESRSHLSKATSTQRNIEPWESLGPHNRGGRTLTLAFNPQNANTLYAGSASGGLWKSYSAGEGVNAWERVETDFPVLGVSSITFAPEDSMTMYIGTGEVYNYYEAGTGAAYRPTRGSFGIGILKSTDGGVNWEKSLDWSMDENHGVWAIRIDPNNPNIIYAATTEGVYKSTDAGVNWSLKLDVVMAMDLLINQENTNQIIAGCGNLNSPEKGIYRSTDAGETWTRITSQLPNYNGKVQFGASPSNPSTLYASIGNSFGGADEASWLCRSQNFGLTWVIRTQTDYSRYQGWFSHNVAVHPTNPEELMVIGVNVWKSIDGGQNITRQTVGGGFDNPPLEGPDGNSNYVHSDAHDVLYHPDNPNAIYIANDGGIHLSLDGGETFTSRSSGYQTTQFYNGFSVSQQDASFCMGGLQDNGTIRWNGDKTWTRVLGGDGCWSAINTQNDDIWYASWQRLNVVRTMNDGDTDQYISIPFQSQSSFVAPYVLAPSDPEILYAASAIVAKSTNHGDSWDITNNGNPLDPAFTPVLSMAISYTDPNVVYAATAPFDDVSAKVFRTLNGEDWENITEDLPNRYPMDIAIDPTNDNIAYITFAGFGSGHVFKTTDNGTSWTDISGALPDVPTNAVIVDPLFPNNIYVGNDLGVFASVDGGLSWETYQEGLPGTMMVFDLKISPVNRKLHVASHGNGAYRRDLLETPVVAVDDLQWVNSLELNVYPNPAFDQVKLDYKLQKMARVIINLHDSNGKNIQLILNEQQQAGVHSKHIDLNNLPKGIYYFQIEVDGIRTTKQLVL